MQSQITNALTAYEQIKRTAKLPRSSRVASSAGFSISSWMMQIRSSYEGDIRDSPRKDLFHGLAIGLTLPSNLCGLVVSYRFKAAGPEKVGISKATSGRRWPCMT